MIFNKTMQAVQDFDSIVKAANESFRETKKQILATYKDPMATNKIQEARDILTETKIRETQKARDEVSADFSAVRCKVNEVVTAAAPADFAATLVAIQAKGNGVTDYEATAYIEKYKGNYLAFSTILEVLHQAGKATDVIACKPDEIEIQITEVERFVMNWIQNHASSNDDGYVTAILTDEKHSLIMKLAAEVQAFLSGGYVLGDGEMAKLAAALTGVGHSNT